MRTLSSTLLAAQRAASATPYIIVIAEHKSGAPVYYFTTPNNKVHSMEHREEPYGGEARIRLKNNDQWFSGKDLRGYKIGIGYGYATASGDEYSIAPPLWVMSQQDVSEEGELLTELICIDIWQKMSWTGVGPDPDTGDVSMAPGYERTYTVEAIIIALLNQMSPSISLTKDSSDGIVDSFQPYYITEINFSIRDIIRDMLEFTKCGMRMRTNEMHLLYMDPATSPISTYDSVHVHWSNIRQRGLVLPNWVIYVDALPSAGVDSVYKGEATDAVSIATFGKIGFVKAPPDPSGITSDAEATTLAESFLARIQAEVNQGVFQVQHHCGQELYDKVQVQDSRSGQTFEGWVGGLTHIFDSSESAETSRNYVLRIRLGGLTEAVTTSDPDRLISDIQGLSKIHDLVKPPSKWTAVPIARGVMPWWTNIIIESGNAAHANKHNACHWAAGAITWSDGHTLVVVAGEITNISGTVYIYWDLEAADVHRLYWSSNFVDAIGPNRGMIASVTEGGVGSEVGIIGRGSDALLVVDENIVIAAITTAKIADGAVVNVKVANAAISSAKLENLAVTTAKLADLVVTAAKIRDGEITTVKIGDDQITAPKIAAGAIATDQLAAAAVIADKIAANAVVADKIAANAVLSDKIMANQILTGHIAAAQVSGEKIMANTISAYQMMAESIDTRELKALSVSTGKLGANSVTADKIFVGWLSAITADLGTVTVGTIVGGGSGVKLRSAIWYQTSGGLDRAYLEAGTSQFQIWTNAGINVLVGANGAECTIYGANKVWLKTLGEGVQVAESGGDPHLTPQNSGSGWLGNALVYWEGGYIYNLYYHNIYTFQDHDDIALVKNMRPKVIEHRQRKEVIIDPESLPPEVRDQHGSEFINAGALQGLTLGAIKQMAERIELLEEEVRRLKHE